MIIWLGQGMVPHPIQNMTLDHLENARAAVASGKINPYDISPYKVNHVCNRAVAFCSDCTLREGWRDWWLRAFDAEFKRRSEVVHAQ